MQYNKIQKLTNFYRSVDNQEKIKSVQKLKCESKRFWPLCVMAKPSIHCLCSTNSIVAKDQAASLSNKRQKRKLGGYSSVAAARRNIPRFRRSNVSWTQFFCIISGIARHQPHKFIMPSFAQWISDLLLPVYHNGVETFLNIKIIFYQSSNSQQDSKKYHIIYKKLQTANTSLILDWHSFLDWSPPLNVFFLQTQL